MVEEGRAIFRFDTFGDEQFWTGRLQLNRAIAGASRGGIGPGVSPKTALAVGLKVDVDALPAELVAKLRRNEVDLDDPATTIALLRLNAVVGVCGHVDEGGGLAAVGVECAFCHSTVDDSFAPGIGKRLDGWPNRDLNVGAIVSLAPDLSFFTKLLRVDERTVRRVLAAWGPDDAAAAQRGEALFDGRARCSTCHVPPLFTEPGENFHRPEEIGIDAFQANRSPTGRYRTAPLKGLWAHQKGGFYHDGRFPTLADVVSHYDRFFRLGLSAGEARDLIEYLKSL